MTILLSLSSLFFFIGSFREEEVGTEEIRVRGFHNGRQKGLYKTLSIYCTTYFLRLTSCQMSHTRLNVFNFLPIYRYSGQYFVQTFLYVYR